MGSMLAARLAGMKPAMAADAERSGTKTTIATATNNRISFMRTPL